jgi:hypothetical protein
MLHLGKVHFLNDGELFFRQKIFANWRLSTADREELCWREELADTLTDRSVLDLQVGYSRELGPNDFTVRAEDVLIQNISFVKQFVVRRHP